MAFKGMRYFSGLNFERMGRWSRVSLLGALFFFLSSCGKPQPQFLIVTMIPKETLVIEMSAYSCTQIVNGIRTIDGYVTPEIQGPVVVFNRMSMEWTRNTRLYVHSAKIRFRGSGIQNGQTDCDLSWDLPALFETPAANNSAIYESGGFLGKGKINSNPNCRIACRMPLQNPEQPEIGAMGEMVVKATEVTNEGTETERYFRVRVRNTVIVRP